MSFGSSATTVWHHTERLRLCCKSWRDWNSKKIQYSLLRSHHCAGHAHWRIRVSRTQGNPGPRWDTAHYDKQSRSSYKLTGAVPPRDTLGPKAVLAAFWLLSGCSCLLSRPGGTGRSLFNISNSYCLEKYDILFTMLSSMGVMLDPDPLRHPRPKHIRA